jgi:hypothetical protein
MGTNYYLIPSHESYMIQRNKFLTSICDILSLSDPFINEYQLSEINDNFLNNIKVHLGKKSSGWQFAFNANEFKYYKNKEEFQSYIRSGRIFNEYGEQLSVEKFEEICFASNNLKDHSEYAKELNLSIIDNMEFHFGKFS